METNILDQYYSIKSGEVKLGQITEESNPGSLMQMLLCLLRTVYNVHQHSHWLCSSPQFYSNHLLFERLYKDAAERVDSLAEKTIGLFGNDSLDYKVQLDIMQGMIKDFISDDHIQNSLKAELKFIEKATETYNKLKETGNLSLGNDDLIMSSINQAEVSVYLLKQAGAKENKEE